MRIYRTAMLVSSCLFLGIGCNPTDGIKQRVTDALTEKAIEGAVETGIKRQTGSDVNVDLDKQGVSFTDPKTGQTFAIGDTVVIPSNFPTDAPRYPGAIAKSVSVVAERNDAALLLETSDARNPIKTWYSEEAVKSGWKVDGTFETADNAILTFTKEENGGTAKLTITISPPDLQKKITIIVGRSGVKK